MKSNPLISIILPVYNVEEYLDECLESILKQTYDNYELLAIDDGSTDNSLKLLESYDDKFSGRLRVISKENGGLSSARNTGLENALGEYVYFLDSDDWILADTLEICIREFSSSDIDLLVFNATAFCDEMPEELLEKYNYTRSLPKSSYKGTDLFSDSVLSGTYVVQSCCYMYKFKHHKDLRFIPGILHEDNYFTTCLFLESEHSRVLTERFFQRRIRANSITTSTVSMKHADGYYFSVDALLGRVSLEKAETKGLNVFYNQLLRKAVSIEEKVLDSRLSLPRKLELAKKYRNIFEFKSYLRLISSRIYETALKLKSK
ncbi:glycosyltransferase [Vibrio sp. NTOU-M3]|uniref:glycosyltransferase n=1 Tax=Vibrio sp. NTOU-M3 TaxID=3234954 RepID=UPI00349FC885